MSLASFPVRHPSAVYLSLGAALALCALTPTPSLPPLVLLVSLLRLQATTVEPRRDWKGAIGQVACVALATGVGHAAASIHALSTPFTSLVVLAALSCITTAIGAGSVAAGYYAERSSQRPWTHATSFPATWATTWAAIERFSPA